jgi:hypothetical protein
MLLVNSTCKICRSCTRERLHKWRDSGLCLTLTHRPTYRLLCINSSPRITDHPTTAFSGSLSYRHLTVPCSENGPQGDTFCFHGGHKIECDGGRFQKKLSAGVLNNIKIDEASVHVRKGPALKLIRQALLYVFPSQCNTTIRELFDCPSYNRTNIPYLLFCIIVTPKLTCNCPGSFLYGTRRLP